MSAIKGLGYRLAAGSGLPAWVHRHLVPGQLSILMYHAVVEAPLPVPDWCFLEAREFRRQLAYLARHFEVLPLSQAARRLYAGEIRRPTLALTFDDGYRNNYRVAYPILKEFGLPATIFLSSRFISSDDSIWFCRLNQALAQTSSRRLLWGGETLSLAGAEDKARAGALLQQRLKLLSGPEIERRVDELTRNLGVDPGAPVPSDSPFRMLSDGELRVMADSGLIEFGGHSHSHFILSQLSAEQQRQEIERSLEMIQRWTGRVCRVYSYPNGRAQDYDQDSLSILRDLGIEAAVTTIPGGNSRQTPPLEMRRYGVGADTDFASFRLNAHHGLSLMKGMLGRA